VDGSNYDIYLSDLSWAPNTPPQKLSTTSNYNGWVRIDGGQVVWHGLGGPATQDVPQGTYESYFYDLSWEPGTEPQNLSTTLMILYLLPLPRRSVNKSSPDKRKEVKEERGSI
jgi:hypothetical protein